MRIRTAGVVSILALSLATAGCGGKTAESSAKTPQSQLTIWADDKRAAVLKPFADKFGAENGVTVKVQAISKDQETAFVTASQQGSGPDVMVGAHDWIGNADAKKIKTQEILCLQVGQTGDAYHLYPFYTSAGGYLFGTTASGDYDPKDLGVGKPGSIAAFKKIATLGEKGDGALKRSITSDNSIATFTGKKCAYLISGPRAVTELKKAGLKYDITPVPGFAGGKPATPFLGVQTFYVAAKGKNKALAQEFVTTYVTTPDLAVALYQAEPRPPALTAAFDQVKATDPDLQKFVDAGKNAVPLPAVPEMAAIWDPFGKAEAAVVGGADPTTTVTAAGRTIQAQIK
jgi:arabinogalactan oligomer/maltooligosaccharide transport system substrate-binding protein